MTAAERCRLDLLLVERGLASSRTRAQGAIMAGAVYVNGQRVEKAGTRVPADAEVEVRREGPRYVSRGGLKLERALEAFGLNVEGARCLDVGASTGGFTDCLLQHGARHVTALDVGSGQLAWSLRQDPRVAVREGVNARYLQPEEVDGPFDLITVDVAFISATKVLPALVPLLASGGRLVVLIKPQFEAGPVDVGRGGVVREAKVHRRVLGQVVAATEELGLAAMGLIPSPVRGAAGNAEFLYCGTRDGSSHPDPQALIEAALAAVSGTEAGQEVEL